jgi:acetyltransferase-like isoleucine patch superfamily enzyme
VTGQTRSGDVVVRANTWLGANVIVLPGVTVGDRCVVEAGSIVSRSLPPDSIPSDRRLRSSASRQGSVDVERP